MFKHLGREQTFSFISFQILEGQGLSVQVASFIRLHESITFTVE
jgi:hypothetical protein